MQRILSLDLDFFLDRVHLDGGYGRLPDDSATPWSPAEVADFLRRIPVKQGARWREATHHDACLCWMETLITERTLAAPAAVTHIDAHADQGLGDDSHSEIMGRLAWLPAEQRPGMMTRLSEGNFLAYAIAFGWVAALEYVTHPSWRGRDLNFFHFEDYDDRSGVIEIKRITPERLERYLPRHEYYIRPYESDLKVPFRAVMGVDWIPQDGYDFLFFCQSPEYTPASADQLLPVLRRWAASLATEHPA